MFEAFSRLPQEQRTLWMVRGISLVSAGWWLDYLIPTLRGEAGPVEIPMFVAALVLLVAAVLGAIIPLAGGLVYVAGACLIAVSAIWSEGASIRTIALAVLPFGIGVLLVVYARRARTAIRPTPSQA